MYCNKNNNIRIKQVQSTHIVKLVYKIYSQEDKMKHYAKDTKIEDTVCNVCMMND